VSVSETRIDFQSLECFNCLLVKASTTFDNDLDYIRSGQCFHVSRYHRDATVKAGHQRITEFRPTVFADYAFVGITVHPAVVSTHPSALLVHRLQEFCAVGVGFALAPSFVLGISAIQMLCVKTGNSIIVVYLVPTFFDCFPSRYVREEPADGAALGALSTLVAFIATESEKHQFIVSPFRATGLVER
jgi:hypothetical protein